MTYMAGHTRRTTPGIEVHAEQGVGQRAAAHHHLSEKGVAQKMQVGPRIPVGIQL
jgi:hypothetical protein